MIGRAFILRPIVSYSRQSQGKEGCNIYQCHPKNIEEEANALLDKGG